MSSDELVRDLQSKLFRDVNESNLPMSVKILVLENILLKANIALSKESPEEEHAEHTDRKD